MQSGVLPASRAVNRQGHGALTCGAAAFAAILWLHLSAPDGYSTDALAYAAAIRDGAPLFHPHHLLYQPSVLVFARGAKLLGFARPEIIGAYLHNLAWAGIGVYALALLIGRATRRMNIAAWAALLLAATAGVGVFATQNDAYVPSLACTIVLLCVVQRFEQDRRRRLLLLAGGTWALATLYHQSAVLLVVPVLWWLVSLGGMRQGARDFATIVFPAAAATLLAYLLGFALEGDGRSAAAFARFVFEYAYADVPLWRNPDNFSVIGIYQTLESQAAAIVNFEAPLLRALAVLALVIVVGGSTAVLIGERNRLGLASALGLGVFWTFNLWWLPGEPELAIVPVAFCVVVVSLAVAALLQGATFSRQRMIGPCLWLGLAMLASMNVGATAPFRTLIVPEKLQIAAAIGRLNSQGCLVLDEYVVTSAAEYFSGTRGVDIQRVLTRPFRQLEPELIARINSASCLFMRAQWLDPNTRILQYAGRERTEAWRRAVISLLAKSGEPQRIDVWPLRIQHEPLLGRVLFVSRSDSIKMSADDFWAVVASAIRPSH